MLTLSFPKVAPLKSTLEAFSNFIKIPFGTSAGKEKESQNILLY